MSVRDDGGSAGPRRVTSKSEDSRVLFIKNTMVRGEMCIHSIHRSETKQGKELKIQRFLFEESIKNLLH